MSVFLCCRLFRSPWNNFARMVWPTMPRERTQSELARLDAELAQRQGRLVQHRQKIEKLRDYLDRCPSPTGDRLRDRLQERERAYNRLLARFQRRKQRRIELNAQLLSSMSRPSREEEDYSDLGYPF